MVDFIAIISPAGRIAWRKDEDFSKCPASRYGSLILSKSFRILTHELIDAADRLAWPPAGLSGQRDVHVLIIRAQLVRANPALGLTGLALLFDRVSGL